MQTYRKKRIEVIIEAPLLRRLVSKLEAHWVTGYSIVPVLAGSGHEGRWEATGLIGDAGRMVAVICIVDPARSGALLDEIYPLVAAHIGILTIADVEVVRTDHF